MPTPADPPESLRVVLAEDGDLLRAGLVSMLEAADGVHLVGVATSLPELLAAVEATDPDVVLTDIRMPPTNTDEGIRAAAQLRVTHPRLGVVALTQYADPEYALELVKHGGAGRGYLLKERVADSDELIRALRAVAAGGSVIDQVVVDDLMADSVRQPNSLLTRLTPRELDVLAQVAQGRSNPAIAERLVVTSRAVEKHINSIFTKLDLPVDSPLHRRVAASLVFLNDAGVGGLREGKA